MTEVDKRIDLFQTYIDLAILDYPLIKNKSLNADLQFFRLQLLNFTKDITCAADKIITNYVAQNPGEQELLKSKLSALIEESRIRFSKRK